MSSTVGRFLRAETRLLTLRSAPIRSGDERPFLYLALVVTWLAGIGRYWDHLSAYLWQTLGLGSVAYVFVLAAILWLVGLPMKPRAWRYPQVLLFVCMTSPPALLYAIPVEQFLPLEVAAKTNLWFLVVVATWRVLLLIRHLWVAAGLGPGVGIVTALLPLAGIVVALAALNLEHSTFELMASPDRTQTAHDEAYGVVFLLSMLSVMGAIPLLVLYCISVGVRRRTLREAAGQVP